MADIADVASRVWYGRGVSAGVARAALAPLGWLYGAGVRARGALYDAHVLRAHDVALPALGVGNVTVGGTGKTPVASWLARRLRAAGARPAIVLRGYGGDEPLVHRLLAPDVEVVVDANRVRGVAEAATRGADVAVLDDAFQHRRARRAADVVLVSAEQARAPTRLLPAGPYREPLSAIGRAAAVIVTRKSATHDDASTVAERMRRARNVPTAVVALALDALRAWSPAGATRELALDALAGERVLAIAGVGDNAAFFAQLAAAGAAVERAPFADHHAYSADDVAALVRRADRVDRIVCTLKDAVKLGPLWPDPGPTPWYVSQRVIVEDGGDVLDQILARLLDARAHFNDTTGTRRPL
jgi:tetraacyldisaccharide 4'-kinase